jgi:hypothetical protein
MCKQTIEFVYTVVHLNRLTAREIKSRISMAKAAFNNHQKIFFTTKLDLNLKKKLVKCYIWSRALYGK